MVDDGTCFGFIWKEGVYCTYVSYATRESYPSNVPTSRQLGVPMADLVDFHTVRMLYSRPRKRRC